MSRRRRQQLIMEFSFNFLCCFCFIQAKCHEALRSHFRWVGLRLRLVGPAEKFSCRSYRCYVCCIFNIHFFRIRYTVLCVYFISFRVDEVREIWYKPRMDGQNLLWVGRKRTTEPKRNFDVKKKEKREEKKAEIKVMKFYIIR